MYRVMLTDTYLGWCVEGQPGKEDVGDLLDQAQEGEHNPVCHPFDILLINGICCMCHNYIIIML